MKYLTDLLPSVRSRIASPVAILLGPPRGVAYLVEALNEPAITCVQMDLFPAARLTEALAERHLDATVRTVADVWDVTDRFQTVILPAPAHTDRELKLDLVDQGYHILAPGGTFLSLSEYETDTEFAKLHKKRFGKCGETPSSKNGMAFFSTKTDDDPTRRRHAMTFHARLGDGPSMTFETWPGVFSYGRMDHGSRALLEVADIRPDDHVLDLGSGCGAVGCLASTKCVNGAITFIDSHLRATALSAKNATANGLKTFHVVASETMAGLTPGSFDVVLANPPYYGDSMVARLFIGQSRELLRPGGRFYIVTKMPTAVVPLIFDTFGGCDIIENRGYSVVTATI